MQTGIRELMRDTSRAPRIRVRVAHGVPLIRSGISALLSSSNEFDLVRPLSSDAGPLGADSCTTDVLIADLDAGLSALASGSACPNVLIVAQEHGEAVIRTALRSGVRGFLLLTCGGEELTTAVKTINRGGTAFSPMVANRLVQSFSYERLTERELHVLHLMMHGLSDKDMANRLLISLGTVKSHMKSIFSKLGAARRTEAAAIAQRRGIARLDSPLQNHGGDL